MNTDFFTVWNVAVIAVIAIASAWAIERFAPRINAD